MYFVVCALYFDMCLNNIVKYSLKKLTVIIIIAISFLGLLIAVIYKTLNASYGLYTRDTFLNNIAAITPLERSIEFEKVFFHGQDGTAHGGVVAKIDNKGVWIWGKKYPEYYKFSPSTSYYIFKNCSREKMLEYENGDITAEVKLENPSSYSEWQTNVNVGTHLFIYSNDNLATSVFINPDVKNEGYVPVFCKKENQ